MEKFEFGNREGNKEVLIKGIVSELGEIAKAGNIEAIKKILGVVTFEIDPANIEKELEKELKNVSYSELEIMTRQIEKYKETKKE